MNLGKRIKEIRVQIVEILDLQDGCVFNSENGITWSGVRTRKTRGLDKKVI
jgi:hypothetical protein